MPRVGIGGQITAGPSPCHIVTMGGGAYSLVSVDKQISFSVFLCTWIWRQTDMAFVN